MLVRSFLSWFNDGYGIGNPVALYLLRLVNGTVDVNLSLMAWINTLDKIA